MPASSARIAGEPLDFGVDATMGSGISVGRGNGETLTRRSPLYLDFDLSLGLDPKRTIEWGAGITVQLEQTPAVAITPQVRLLRGRQPIRYYAGLGIPAYVTPFTLFGGELAGGAIYELDDGINLVGGGQLDVFAAGSDIPDDGVVVMFNVGLGGRVLF